MIKDLNTFLLSNTTFFQVNKIFNQLRIAVPQTRDDKMRAPCIPEAALKRRMMKLAKQEIEKKKTERDIELEMGDDYVLDLKKNYNIEGDQKFDVIPELWEGHNVADYIDPEIFEARIIVNYTLKGDYFKTKNVFRYRNWWSWKEKKIRGYRLVLTITRFRNCPRL